MEDVDFNSILRCYRTHPLGEGRYDLQGTPRAAPGGVATRWNRTTIPPRVRTAALVHWTNGPFSPSRTPRGTHPEGRPTALSRLMGPCSSPFSREKNRWTICLASATPESGARESSARARPRAAIPVSNATTDRIMMFLHCVRRSITHAHGTLVHGLRSHAESVSASVARRHRPGSLPCGSGKSSALFTR
jgi:hypothetical protein